MLLYFSPELVLSSTYDVFSRYSISKAHCPKNKTHETACYGKLSSIFATYISGKLKRSQVPNILNHYTKAGTWLDSLQRVVAACIDSE
jgi:hypothetical protein